MTDNRDDMARVTVNAVAAARELLARLRDIDDPKGYQGEMIPEHAEAQIIAHNPKARAIGVSKATCPACESMFRRYAIYVKQSIAVSTPVGDYVYRADGSVIFVDTDGSARRTSGAHRAPLGMQHSAATPVIVSAMSRPISETELQEIERRVSAATPGPWSSWVEGRDHESGSSFIMTGEGASRGEDLDFIKISVADQDFIAAARQDVPRLIAAVRELMRQLDELEGR